MRRSGRLRAAVLAAGAAGLILSAIAAEVPPAAAAAGGTSAPAGRALIQAYLSGRHLPAGAVSGLRPGSLHTATAAGATWAIAAFTPAAPDSRAVRDQFQDDAATGIFRRAPGRAWRLVRAGPASCGRGLPAGLDRAWDLPGRVICRPGIGAQRRAAALARSGPDRTLGQSIARIALGQVGVADAPAVTSFGSVDCDPYSTLVGALSPDADGCGFTAVPGTGPNAGSGVQDENEPWCADFAKWVWQRAGVTADLGTLDAGAGSFYAWGLQAGEKLAADQGRPAAGDAVVFYPPGTISRASFADHVGLVTTVNRDGTVSLVNGDFLGSSGISVQYDTDVRLTSWAAEVWGRGEQWVLVAPPGGPQPAEPSVTISGPRVAVAGTAVSFTAGARVSSGSVTHEQWTFGDGRTQNQAGPHVSTVFTGAGVYPVTLTASSSLGTAATAAVNVDVIGASAAVTSEPSDAVWYSTTPVSQLLFLPGPAGLAAEASDGAGPGTAGWLRQAVPGQPAPGGLAALAYPDQAAGDAMTAHVYFRSASGTLAETYQAAGGWTTLTLPGKPEAGTAVAAATRPGAGPADGTVVPDVFYFDGSGRLSVTAGPAWTAAVLGGPAASAAGSLAAASTAAGTELFYLGPHSALTEAAQAGRGWRFSSISSPYGVTPGSPLAAVSAGAGQAEVFFADRRGHLAVAVAGGTGWTVRQLPPATAPVALAAVSDLLPGSGPGGPGQEAFWLSRAGQPAVTAWNGRQWQTAALPGPATGILGASAYPGSPQELFLADGTALRLDADAGPGWTAATLPDTPATLAARVLLYAATPADDASASRAAAAAGLARAQVSTSFGAAWAATLSGNYLVIAVGRAALDALDFNQCGWANPSGDGAGATPFYLSGEPLDQLPGADAYENAAAAAPAQTPALASALAYYAAHGRLPPGSGSLPARAAPRHACAGRPG